MNASLRRTLVLAGPLALTLALPAVPAGAGGGCHGPAGAPPAAEGSVVTIETCRFGPAVLEVQPGTEVRFENHDLMVHVVQGTGWGDPGQIRPGEAVEHRFAEVGVYPYSCYLHPGMNGAVVVGGAPPPAGTAVVASVSPGRDGGAQADLALTDRTVAVGGGPGVLGGVVAPAAGGALLALLGTGWWRRRRAGR